MSVAFRCSLQTVCCQGDMLQRFHCQPRRFFCHGFAQIVILFVFSVNTVVDGSPDFPRSSLMFILVAAWCNIFNASCNFGLEGGVELALLQLLKGKCTEITSRDQPQTFGDICFGSKQVSIHNMLCDANHWTTRWKCLHYINCSTWEGRQKLMGIGLWNKCIQAVIKALVTHRSFLLWSNKKQKKKKERITKILNSGPVYFHLMLA